MKYLAAALPLAAVALLALALVGAEELRFRIWLRREKRAIRERVQRYFEEEVREDDDP